MRLTLIRRHLAIYFLPFRGRSAQKAAWENCAELFGFGKRNHKRESTASCERLVELCVADCVADCIRFTIPEPTGVSEMKSKPRREQDELPRAGARAAANGRIELMQSWIVRRLAVGSIAWLGIFVFRVIEIHSALGAFPALASARFAFRSSISN